MADDADHFIDIGDRNRKTDQDVGTLARLAQKVFGAPRHHVLAERDERLQHVDEVHQFRLAAVERHHVDAERGLKRRPAVKLVDDHIGIGITLEFDDDPVTVAVGFIAQIGNALDALLPHEFGHFLDHG